MKKVCPICGKSRVLGSKDICLGHLQLPRMYQPIAPVLEKLVALEVEYHLPSDLIREIARELINLQYNTYVLELILEMNKAKRLQALPVKGHA